MLRHQKNSRHHNNQARQFSNNKNPLLYDGLVALNIIVLGIICINLIAILARTDNTRQRFGFSNLLIMGVLQIFLEIVERQKRTQQMSYVSLDMNTEIEKSRTIIQKTKHIELRDELLQNVDLLACNSDHPFQLSLRSDVDNIDVSWAVGENALFEQTKRVIKLSRALINFPELKNKFDAPPSEFNELSSLQYFKDFIIDMSAKRRAISLIGLFQLMLSVSLANLWGYMHEDSSHAFDSVFIPTLALSILIIVPATVLESSILREAKLKFNLEGFSSLYRTQVDFPIFPCVPLQITQGSGVIPTKALKGTTAYLAKNMEKIADLPLNKLPVPIKRMVEELKENVQLFYGHDGRKIIKMHFFNKSANHKTKEKKPVNSLSKKNKIK